MPPVAAIYCRVSTGAQGAEARSLPAMSGFDVGFSARNGPIPRNPTSAIGAITG